MTLPQWEVAKLTRKFNNCVSIADNLYKMGKVQVAKRFETRANIYKNLLNA